VAGLRKKFCDGRRPKAPSSCAHPETFLNDQKLETIYFNRPSDTPDIIPVTLLHPIFGQFIDDCEKHSPTADDYALATELVVMEEEDERETEILNAFHDPNIANISIKGSRIGDYTTDGDPSVSFLSIANKIVLTQAEPYFQGILSYLESTRDQAPKYLHSVLPCMIVLLFGPYISFVGVAWTDRLNAQTLSLTIPCHFHFRDDKMKIMLARHLGALKCALLSLE